MIGKNQYTPLHLHTMLSNCVTNIDSITSYQEYIDAAKEFGMNAMAITEHGSVIGWCAKYEAMKKAGLKYIHAAELYVTESFDEEKRDNYHVTLLAKNYDGVQELNKLSSVAFNRTDTKIVDKQKRFFYVPRISFEELLNTSNNILILTGCLGGIMNNGPAELQKKFIEFGIKHPDRFWLEVQHHNVEQQKKHNKKLYEIHKKTGLRIVATADTHSLNADHSRGRLMLQKAKNIHFSEEDEWDLEFKTYDQLLKAFIEQGALPIDVIKDAIEETNRIANIIEPFDLDKSYKYPHIWEDSEGLLKTKIAKGIKWRRVNEKNNFDEYKKRIAYEFNTYKHNGSIDYLLLMSDITDWCREQKIPIGYGRGSVNGSVIAYLLGITEMDAIVHGLNFERFANVDRVSLADIDTDFAPSRINEVKEYVYNRHGLQAVDIITYNTISDKGAIRDIGRAMQIPLSEVNTICESVDDAEQYKLMRGRYPELFEYVDLCKGVAVSMGNHPCGMIVTEDDIPSKIGTLTTSTDKFPVSQIAMKEIELNSYVKLDLLKLDNIEIIAKACEYAGIPMLLPDTIDVNDMDVWRSIRDDSTAIFQWEGASGKSYIKRLMSDENIEALKKIDPNMSMMSLFTIGNSAIRPAGNSYREELANAIVPSTGSKEIDEFLKPRFGRLCFQEDILAFLHDFCGFTMGEADICRRKIGKKLGTEDLLPIIKSGGYLTEDKKHYIPGFIATMKEKHGMSEEDAESAITSFLQIILDASNYSFSLNHSSPYSFEGLAEGWLRYYYPLEFITAALSVNQDKEERVAELTKYAHKRGIKVLSPMFGKSKADYFFNKDENSIYRGVGSIKYCNNQIADELWDLSQNGYENFFELLVDVDEKTSVDSRQMDLLVKIGFFSSFHNAGKLLKMIDLYNKVGSRKIIKKKDVESFGLSEDIIRQYARTETEKQFKDFDKIGLLNELAEGIEDVQVPIREQIQAEIEYLGYIIYTNPTISPLYYIVIDYKTYGSNTARPYVTVRNLHDGEEIKTKVTSGKLYQSSPFGLWSILSISSFTEKPKMRKVNGEWVATDEMEKIISEYETIVR